MYSKRELSLELLNNEYLNWALSWESRNDQDLRFGQYLQNKYDMSMYEVDVFYIEDYENVYSKLLDDIYSRV